MTTKSEIVSRLEAVMDRHGFNVPQMARYLGVPTHTLIKWLNGTRTPSSVLLRLLHVLALVEMLAPTVHNALIER